MSDIVERLWASDAASALTNEAAREITLLRQQLASARVAALEEAAKVSSEYECHLLEYDESLDAKVHYESGMLDAGQGIATAIRSLKSGQEWKR